MQVNNHPLELNMPTIMRPKDSTNAWSVATFESERTHLTNFVRENVLVWQDDPECRRMLIRAPVKSGKREIVEYIAVRDISPHPQRMHVFISAWHRAADEKQRGELNIHNVRVFSIVNDSNATECNRWIQQHIRNGMQITIHIDECDFGSGSRQKLGQVYQCFRENPACFFILYSATPQEVLFSGELNDPADELYDELIEETRHGVCVEYTPPIGYCGPAKFISEGLVHEAKPFFKKYGDGIRLSDQGSSIIRDVKDAMRVNPDRNLIVLRLSSSDGKHKEDKHIYQFLRGINGCAELDGISIIAAKGESTGQFGRVRFDVIEWSNPEYWLALATGRPFILVIDQTASRSTEFVCHNRIFAYHEYRNQVAFTTCSQAQERSNHYELKYGGFQPIRIYGHVKTFKLSAGLISYGEYMETVWCKKKITHENLYRIKHIMTGLTHPDYPQAMTSNDADNILHQLGCFVRVKVSDRVRGRIKNVSEFGCHFIPCTQETFHQEIHRKLAELNIQQRLLNPFATSFEKGLVNGQLQGYLRGWGVFTFDDVYANRGWGMTGPRNTLRITVCYSEGQLGVAVRWKTGRSVEINTLETFRSMYARRN